MRLRRILFGLAMAAALPGGASACSQCMCGTPFPADVLGGVVPMEFSYGIEDRYLSKENALDEEIGSEEEREHRIAAFGLWRPHERLALIGRLPYNVKQITERPQSGVETIHRAQGLGDAELLSFVGLLNRGEAVRTTLGLILGVTAPTGSSDLKDDAGERLDAHLQPGTGAWSGTGGVHLAFTVASGVWDASVMGRASTKNAHGYRYGNLLLYNAGYTTKPWKTLQFMAQINGRSADRDRLEDATLGANTGGTVSYASPGVRWISSFGLALEAAVQIPLQQSLVGDQTEHTTGKLTLSMIH